jgi:hypothetical protein
MVTIARETVASRRWSRELARRLEMALTGSVGMLALCVSAYTVYVQRQQLKVLSWPRLTIEGDSKRGSDASQIRLTLSLKNRGIAPAEVRSMHIEVGKKSVSNWLDWLKAMQKLQGSNVLGSFSTAYSPAGNAIGVGQDVPLFVTESLQTAALIAADDATVISICYCSVLDDCWILEDALSGDATTSPVARCPTYPTRFAAVPDELNTTWTANVLDAGVPAARKDGGAK